MRLQTAQRAICSFGFARNSIQDKKMKKVILFGDSIRLGYQQYVKESFDGVAEVFVPDVNCAFAQNTLRYANIWKEKFALPEDADLIHWNVGLWDVLRIMGDDVFTPPEFYAQLIARLRKRFSLLFPKAKQVFATSTSVVEEGYEYPYQRYNKDIELFNKIAIETLIPLGAEINDLYTLTKGLPESCRSDMTHFYTEQGIKAVGNQVVKSICEVLQIPFTINQKEEVLVPKFSKEVVGN